MLISPTGSIFESPWASFFTNLFTFMLFGHVVGSWWYLFGLQVYQWLLFSSCNCVYYLQAHYVSIFVRCVFTKARILVKIEARSEAWKHAHFNLLEPEIPKSLFINVKKRHLIIFGTRYHGVVYKWHAFWLYIYIYIYTFFSKKWNPTNVIHVFFF